MRRPVVAPDAHQPWCEDRDLPTTEGHLGEGVQRCNGPTVRVGSTPIYLVESPTHGVNIHVEESEYTLPQAVAIADAITTVVGSLGGS